MEKKSIVVGCVFFLSICLISFVTDDSPVLQQRLIRYFQKLDECPQEKLYLHVDKPYYAAGEKIWLRGYLVNATSHQDNEMSNFIYVELVDRNDSVMVRKKFKRDSCGFSGCLPLSPELSSDQYYLRGYTSWMRNTDSSFFYLRNIEIRNAIARQIESSVSYQTDDEKSVVAVIRFTDQQQEPIADMKVKTRLKEADKTRKTDVLKTNEQGEIRFRFSKNSVVCRNNPCIEVEFIDDIYVYQRKFFLPPFTDDYAVTFFPEGGNLLSGQLQTIAFKAQHESGFSESVTGCVVNQRGDTLVPIITQHDGMGMFSLLPVPGDSYFAKVISSKGIEKSIPLPEAQSQGLTLSLVTVKNVVHYKVLSTESTVWPDSLFVLAHTRGQLKYLYPVTRETSSGSVPAEVFEDGITHFLLVDPEGQPISERLVFFLKPRYDRWSVESDGKKKMPRQPVDLKINLSDSTRSDLSGLFSVSITDRSQVSPDTLSDNILSNLLLTSDLKGYIDRPGYYFDNPDRAKLHYLNLIMLTHGWSRHKFERMVEDPVVKISHFLERGQYVSGWVRSAMNKPRKGAIVSLVAPALELSQFAETDSEGRFLFNPPAFHDTVDFFLSVKPKNTFDKSEVLVDRDSFPLSLNNQPYRIEPSRYSEAYLENSRDTYFEEGGTPIFYLKEVVVTAKQKAKRVSSFSGGAADYVQKAEALKQPGVTTVLDALRRIGSLNVSAGGQITLRGKEPLILVNDVSISGDFDLLNRIAVEELDEVRILKGAESVIVTGLGSQNGVVIITLTTDFVPEPKPNYSMARFKKLGFSSDKEFYTPVYDTPESRKSVKKDLRSTVYWNPRLSMDSDGTCSVRFYTSDHPGDYHIVIEGIGSDGRICRYESDLKE